MWQSEVVEKAQLPLVGGKIEVKNGAGARGFPYRMGNKSVISSATQNFLFRRNFNGLL
jgi:hypothetical protein